MNKSYARPGRPAHPPIRTSPFGEALWHWWQTSQWRLADIATALGVTSRTLQRWIAASGVPSRVVQESVLAKLQALQVVPAPADPQSISREPLELGHYYFGDALDLTQRLDTTSVNCIVTSPPYWSLRTYLPEHAPQKPLEIGTENGPKEYTRRLVAIFRELRRVLRPDGVCWLNIGDTFAGGDSRMPARTRRSNKPFRKGCHAPPDGLKPKEIVGLPWMVAFALREEGWFVRMEIIWSKTRYKPSAVRDRPTLAHEHVFLLTKSARYYYDCDAVRTPLKWGMRAGVLRSISGGRGETGKKGAGGVARNIRSHPDGANAGSVWAMATSKYPGTHTAVFPEELVDRCILAGCPKGGVVLDPFAGTGTTLAVAQRLGRRFIGFELNSACAPLIAARFANGSPVDALGAENRPSHHPRASL